MTKYTEIFKLKEKLEKANIPFIFKDRSRDGFELYQIIYPNTQHCQCSIVEGEGSIGGEHNLLEIMGLLTAEERKEREVCDSINAKCDAWRELHPQYDDMLGVYIGEFQEAHPSEFRFTHDRGC